MYNLLLLLIITSFVVVIVISKLRFKLLHLWPALNIVVHINLQHIVLSLLLPILCLLIISITLKIRFSPRCSECTSLNHTSSYSDSSRTSLELGDVEERTSSLTLLQLWLKLRNLLGVYSSTWHLAFTLNLIAHLQLPINLLMIM